MDFLFLLLPLFVFAQQPSITTTAGDVLGFRISTGNGEEADVFLGIPYAKPPVGLLRFEKPQPPEPWSTPINATSWGKECLPHTPLAIETEADEDCLTLNIIRPTKKAPPTIYGYAILFWIHGGGYQFGSARRYPYQGFADAYATRDTIVVSIQYRLGIFGFLSNGQDDLPGNLGLWDMAGALKFIYENAENIGGDPKRITLWGLSAGGAAVGQLLLSPETTDLVAGGIEMSGSPWNNWVVGHHVVNHSISFLEAIGCTKHTKTCLKAKSTDEIYKAVDKVGYVLDNLLIAKWAPRLDGKFLPYDLDTLVRKTTPKPVLIGYTEKEASYMTIMGKSRVIHSLAAQDNLLEFHAEEMRKRIKELVNKSVNNTALIDETVDDIIAFYSKGTGAAKYLNDYTDFVSDVVFNVGIARGAEARIKSGWPIHLYRFEHYNKVIWKNYKVPEGVWGSVHINEFPYMFELFGLGNFDWTEEEVIIRDNLRNSIATFAHNGMASWGGMRWKEAGKDMSYIKIKVKSEEAKGFLHDSLKFWEGMKATGYDLIEMAPVNRKKEEL